MHHLNLNSRNKKTGPIAVSTHTNSTCPDSCPLKNNGCYAEYGPLALHWKKISKGERGTDWTSFCESLGAIPRGHVWRYGQAGDLPGRGNRIDTKALKQLTRANKGRRGFAYTHKPLTPTNLKAITEANSNGFTINISANNKAQASTLFKTTGLPTVTMLPIDAPNDQTVDGVRVVACPAEKSDKVTCANCQLCADKKRGYVIGFRAHGTGKKKANQIATTNI